MDRMVENRPVGGGNNGDPPQLPQPLQGFIMVQQMLACDEKSHDRHGQLMERMLDLMQANQVNQGGRDEVEHVPKGFVTFLQTHPLVFLGGKDPLDADY